MGHSNSEKRFIPAHKNFRVIAIAAPVPPYTGYPIDPPFRSRFQARFMDPIGAMVSLTSPKLMKPLKNDNPASSPLFDKIRNVILSTQYASETHHTFDAVAKSVLQTFPQTALVKLRSLLTAFPPIHPMTPGQLTRLILTLHPGLGNAPFVAWAMLSRQFEETGLGPLGSASLDDEDISLGYMGYKLRSIERATDSTVRITFEHPNGPNRVTLDAPSGPRDLLAFPWINPKTLGFFPTERFMGLLTCMLQGHTLGWDLSYVPPASLSTASCSTSTLVKTFAALLGYELDTVHMYKELGGRELIMRRKVDSDGSTSWEPRYGVVLFKFVIHELI